MCQSCPAVYLSMKIKASLGSTVNSKHLEELGTSVNHFLNLWHGFHAGQADPSPAVLSFTQPDCFCSQFKRSEKAEDDGFGFDEALHTMIPWVQEEILCSQYATKDSLREWLFCAESTTLLDVTDEYFSVNTLFVLVMPVQVRGSMQEKLACI